MIFNETYNRESFLEFLRNFLPEDFVKREQDLSHIDSCKVVNQASELGVSQSLGVHVLEMSYGKDTDPRVAIATDAFRILATYQIDKALVIFKSNNSKNYRFSLLTISLDVNQKSKLVRTYSNARRFSFYLGPGAKARTPQHQLITKGRVKDMADLVERFSLEVVNKQFYLELVKHFDALVDNDKRLLSLPSQSDQNIRKSFAMRLIGRIMFCWFLKQKHSPTNGPLIPDALLSSRAVKDSYYHNTLEPVFFGILNTPIEARDIRGELYDSVPYLNGGLFNPQHDDYYDLDRDTLVSKHINTLVISDDWFRDFFSLLETYNFTIDENTVFDQELSVDPEMLGRIFENLLAEINPETGSSERKRTGSYYTPRQIVEYMVDRSLVEHLKTKTSINEQKLAALVSYDLSDDPENPLTLFERKSVIEAIDSLRLIDPACGSGAFPIGALQKIVWVLQRVDTDCQLWLEKKLEKVPELYRQKIRKDATTNPFDYIRKLDIIKNSIFGVDIQPIAVEIARLRCFLTLVVESEVNDGKPNRGVEPLPNLDFKFVCANTLVPAPEESGGGNQLFVDDFEEKLSTAVDRYFSSFGTSKSSAGNDIHRLIDSKVDEQLRRVQSLVAHADERYQVVLAKAKKKSIDTHTRILTLWASYKNLFENKPVGFFDPKYFFPGVKNGFDIVIGNPPYIKEYTNRTAFDGLRGLECYQGKMDLWYLFACAGIDLLRNEGVLSFIAQNNWVTSSGASKMRNKVISETEIVNLVDFGSFKIFETAGIQTMIMIFRKSSNRDEYRMDLRRLIGNVLTLSDVNDLLQRKENARVEYLYPKIKNKEFLDNKLTFSDSVVEEILNKIQLKSNFKLNQREEVAQGIVYPQDKVNKASRIKLNNTKNIGDGIFVINENEKRLLHLMEKEDLIVKPSFTTAQLKKWYGDPKNKEWVIYTNSSFQDQSKMTDYPNLKRHLDQFKDVITSSNKPYGLHRARIEDFFKGEKIISTRKCTEPTFTYTDFDCYVSATFYIIKTSRLNQKYLTGLLNSKLFAFWLRHKGKMQGVNYQIDKEPILELPIIAPSYDVQNKMADIVDKIIFKKARDEKADISDLESTNNEFVYQLYELTTEEIEVIEKDKVIPA